MFDAQTATKRFRRTRFLLGVPILLFTFCTPTGSPSDPSNRVGDRSPSDQPSAYTILVSKSGAQVAARRVSGQVLAMGTAGRDDAAILQSAVNAVKADAGGGTIRLQAATYTLGLAIDVCDVAHRGMGAIAIEGEDRERTILEIRGKVGLALFCTEIMLRDLTFDGMDMGGQLVASGQPIILDVGHCRFRRHIDIGLWLGYEVKRVHAHDNVFEQPAGSNDQMAFTCKESALIENNTFDRTAGTPKGSCLTSGGATNAIIRANTFKRNAYGAAVSIEPYGQAYVNLEVTKNQIEGGSILLGGDGPWQGGRTTYQGITVHDNNLRGGEISAIGPRDPQTGSIATISLSNNVLELPFGRGLAAMRVSGPVRMEENVVHESNQSLDPVALVYNGLVVLMASSNLTVRQNRLRLNDVRPNASPYAIRYESVNGASFMGNQIENASGHPGMVAAGINTNVNIE